MYVCFISSVINKNGCIFVLETECIFPAEVVMGVEEEVITGNELELVQAEEVVTSLTMPREPDESVDAISAVAVGEADVSPIDALKFEA